MPIEVICSSCQRPLRVPDDLVGQRVKCPSCANTFTAEESGKAQESVEQTKERLSSGKTGPKGLDEPPPPRRDEAEPPPPPWSPSGDSVAHRGPLILTLGIISCSLGGLGVLAYAGMLCCGLFAFAGLLCSACAVGLGLPSWIMGQRDLKKIRNGEMDPEGEPSTKRGWICGTVGTILGALGLLCGIIGILVAALFLGVSIASQH
jgi:hypothetical protein